MKKFATLLTLIIVILMITVLAGCTKMEQNDLRERVVNAWEKQQEAMYYEFTGEADLNIPGLTKQFGNDQPLSSMLLDTLQAGHWTWKGAVDLPNNHTELQLLMEPGNSENPLDMPMIIKDNKMYFTMPLFIPQASFFELDLEQYEYDFSQGGQIFLDGMIQHMNEWDKDWFHENVDHKEPIEARTIVLNINEDNFSTVFESLRQGLIEKLGIEMQASEFRIDQPGTVTFELDGQDNLKAISMDLSFLQVDQTEPNQITMRQTYTQLNKAPIFELEVPKNAVSFDRVLKLIQP